MFVWKGRWVPLDGFQGRKNRAKPFCGQEGDTLPSEKKGRKSARSGWSTLLRWEEAPYSRCKDVYRGVRKLCRPAWHLHSFLRDSLQSIPIRASRGEKMTPISKKEVNITRIGPEFKALRLNKASKWASEQKRHPRGQKRCLKSSETDLDKASFPVSQSSAGSTILIWKMFGSTRTYSWLSEQPEEWRVKVLGQSGE